MANEIDASNYLKRFEGNNIRPYSSMATEHDDPIATIILYNQKASNPSGSSNNTDYFQDYSNKVETLYSGSINSSVVGYPEIPAGDTPMLSLNTDNDYYGVFNNFSVTGISENHDQITKVHMNFSARWNVFFFGNTPNIYQVRGVFLDTVEYPYYQEFLVAYEKYLSGRKCVENKMQTKLMVSGQIIDGYLMSVAVNHNSQTQTLKEFTFSMLVKGVSWIRVNLTHPGGLEEGANLESKLVFNGLSNINRFDVTKAFNNLPE
jgi:hypothetical protein